MYPSTAAPHHGPVADSVSSAVLPAAPLQCIRQTSTSFVLSWLNSSPALHCLTPPITIIISMLQARKQAAWA